MNPPAILRSAQPLIRDTIKAVTTDHVLKRILWLYGLYSLLNNVMFLVGYYVLLEGFLRDPCLRPAAKPHPAPVRSGHNSS